MKLLRTRITPSCILRGMAFSALTNMAVLLAMPVDSVRAADEVQVLRKAPSSMTGVVPFTTFQQEELAVTQSLPCKWISKDGRLGPSYGGARYDFLCKGGDFATVSLYLDKADSAGSGVAKARLLYRDWPVNANPNAGEALVAQQFLQHVAGRFIPAAMAGEVMDAFWSKTDRKWNQNGVNIAFVLEKGPQFNVRRLEIAGTGAQLNSQLVKMYPVTAPTDTGLTKTPPAAAVLAPVKAPEEPQPTQLYVYGKNGEKLNVTQDTGLTKTITPVAPIPANVMPAVVVPVPTGVLPTPGLGARKPGDALVVPVTTPAGGAGDTVKEPEKSEELQQATPAELNTAPAPESKAVPVPPPAELSATLVPSTKDLVNGSNRSRAPSNFDAYNRAMELTKDVEAKAQIAKVEEAKVTASKPVTPTAVSGTTYVTPSTITVPALKPVPTPQIDKPIEVPATPANTAGEGLATPKVTPPSVTAPVAAPVVTTPAVDEVGQPTNYNGPRSSEVRPLPQLKFVPKAEPLHSPDEVIQFEDEKSKL